MSTANECRCGRPTRDAAYVCDDCAHSLAVALGDVAWLEEELETTITRTRGVDYRRSGGGKGARSAPRGDTRIKGDNSPESPRSDTPALGAHIQQDGFNMAASEARTTLRGLLVTWARFCLDEGVRNSSPSQALPADNLTALSRWLLWRVDGLTLLDIGAEAVDEITDAVAGCHRQIDRPADKMYAGKCGFELEDVACPNELYVKVGARSVRCSTCGTTWDVPERRAWLLAEAIEVLATAAEISRAVSWLGSVTLTAERVRQWASRDRLITRGHDRANRPLYRVGDAIDLLANGGKKGEVA